MGAVYTVKLHGGPRDNETLSYAAPLPETLCVIEKPNRFTIEPTYHDYTIRDGQSKSLEYDYDWVGKTSARAV